MESYFGHFKDVTKKQGGQDHRTVRMMEKPFPCLSSLSSEENRSQALRRVKKFINKKNAKNSNNLLGVSREQYNAYFKFTIVRNPWDRALSWYDNVLRNEYYLKKYSLNKDIYFGDFLRSSIGKSALRSQLYWIRNFKGDVDLDYIAKFENLEEGFRTIAKALNLEGHSLPHELNVNRKAVAYQDRYDEESKKLVSEFYANEIKLFNYKFD